MSGDTKFDSKILTDQGSIGYPDFETNLLAGGKELAEKVRGARSFFDRICVVTSAQDRDFLAAPLADAFPEAYVSIATLWNKFRPASGAAGATSSVLAEHNQVHPAEVDAIVGVSLSLAEAATVADNMLRVASLIKSDLMIAAIAVASPPEEEDLHLEFRQRSNLIPRIVTLSTDYSSGLETVGARSLKNHREHLVTVYKNRGQAYIPQTLGGRKPDFKPTHSPNLTPG